MACCRKCPHLESCAQDHQIDLYCLHYFDYDPYDGDTDPSDDYDTIGEFLALKRCETCTKEYREVMDEQYPND